MSKVWLVTGSASGLGRNIAEAVLASGDFLVATARDPRRLKDLAEKYGDQIRTAPLDVADAQAAQASVQMAVDAFGRLDVVVNESTSSSGISADVNEFTGKRVLVTGGTKGAGKAIADRFWRWRCNHDIHPKNAAFIRFNPCLRHRKRLTASGA
jgi:NAD(P)-dependent dehydrogenase (short-subunit alcohol dehydrogenase family)